MTDLSTPKDQHPASAPLASGSQPRAPRLVYYNDAHHFHAKRLDPPVSRHKLYQPVDELMGTGVELLAFGLGYSDVYFHQSKIGRVVGQHQDVWRDFIDWRIYRMVRDAHDMGTDQVREVIGRGRKKGLRVFPSLKLQDPSNDDPVWIERFGLLKMKHGKSVCLNELDDTLPMTDWCYDYTLDVVREEKLAMVREMLDDYDADGIELDFCFRPRYFRKAEVDRNTPTMTAFVAQVRALADEIGARKGRYVPIMARVSQREDDNLAVGLDVRTWLNEKSVDYVVGQVFYSAFETNSVEGEWLGQAAQNTGSAAYIRPPTHVFDERTPVPSIEMYRALVESVRGQGFTGLYLAGMSWPFAHDEYQALRETAYPETIERRSKRYILAPNETGTYYSGPSDRQLPIELREGVIHTITVRVADDLDAARADGELRKSVLTIWFSDLCADDEVEVRFNGTTLPLSEAEVIDEGAATIASKRISVDDRWGYNAYWYRFTLEDRLLRQGENTLQVETKRREETAGFARTVNIVEVHVRYREFERAIGIHPQRLPIRW